VAEAAAATVLAFALAKQELAGLLLAIVRISGERGENL
jgi:hypothetical protein